MRPSPEELGDFRLADILSFLAVRRCGSVSAAARELKVTPSQISKSVARLEFQLNVSLLVRGGRGVSLSEAGTEVAPHLEEAHHCRAVLSVCSPCASTHRAREARPHPRAGDAATLDQIVHGSEFLRRGPDPR